MSTTSENQSSPVVADSPSFRLYIGHLPETATKAELRQVLQDVEVIGLTVQKKVIKRLDRTNRFAFVSLASESDASKALETLKAKLGDDVIVETAQPKPAPKEPKEPKQSKQSKASEDSKDNKSTQVPKKKPQKPRGPTTVETLDDAVYIELPKGTKKPEVLELFEGYEGVNARVKYRPSRRARRQGGKVVVLPPRLFAIVEVGKDRQERAISEFDGKDFKGQPLVVKPAQLRVPAEPTTDEANNKDQAKVDGAPANEDEAPQNTDKVEKELAADRPNADALPQEA